MVLSCQEGLGVAARVLNLGRRPFAVLPIEPLWLGFFKY